jgi:predicted HD phosphohydrolase
MAAVFTRTERRQEWCDDSHMGSSEEEEDNYDSTTSEEPYNSDDDGAPDLAVEASPFQRDGGGDDGRPRKDDVEASFFSDYEAEVRSRAPATASLARRPPPSPPPLYASPLAKCGNDAFQPPICGQQKANAVDANDGDAFYDAAYASSMGKAQKRVSSPSPVPEAVAHWERDRALSTSSSHHNGRHSSSWLDPLRSLSSPPIDMESDCGGQPARPMCAPHGLSDSPQRGSDPSRSAPQSDTPLSHCSPPSVTVREGTAAPAAHARHGTLSVDVTSERQSYVRGSIVHGNMSAEESNALPPRATTRSTTNGPMFEPRKVSVPPSPPPPTKMRQVNESTHCDASFRDMPTPVVAAASSQGELPHTLTAQGTDVSVGTTATVVRAQVPGLRPLSTSLNTNTSQPQLRVVRDQAPRGVSLLLQCTGHAHTPTRTVVIPYAAERDGTDDDEGTVNVGLHTSAYRETSGMSDIISSSLHDSPAASAKKATKRDNTRRMPESANDAHRHRCHRRTKRSKSPFVSLVDNHLSGAEHATSQPPHSSSSLSPASSASSQAEAGATAASAPPELVDFSVHTEALERNAQEDSLFFCGYSVESFTMSAEASHTDGAEMQRPAAYPPADALPHRPHPPMSQRNVDRSSVGMQRTNASLHPQPSSSATEFRFSASPNRRGAEGTTLTLSRLLNSPTAHPQTAAQENSSLPWPSPELVCPVAQAAVPTAGVAAARLHNPKHPSQVFNVHYVVDSVEEAAVGEGSDQVYTKLYTWQARDCSRERPNSTPIAAVFAPPPTVGDDTFNFASTTPTSITEYSFDELQQRRQQREAVRHLLARQTDPWRTSASRTRCADGDGGGETGERSLPLLPPPPRYSAVLYMAQQEQLRSQRMAAEAERLRLGLALDVCQAVRPHGRDLLLMLLLLVEESNAAQRRHQRRRSYTSEGGRNALGDPTEWEESRVSYDVCAEAINCVLERHGISWVRATRGLCHRVVAWCRCHDQHSSSTMHDKSASVREPMLVEYTTFVSCVMEFAARYADSNAGHHRVA